MSMSEESFQSGTEESETVVIAPEPPFGSADDHLATTRLPPVPRPPASLRLGVPSAPPPLHPSKVASFPPASTVSRVAPDGVSVLPPPAAGGVQKTSWWKALLQSTLPPQSFAPSERAVRVRLAASSVVLSFVLVVVAVLVGLRPAPSYSLTAPNVAAAMLLSRAAVAVGLLAFAIGLLRTGERLYRAAARTDRGAGD